MAGGRFDSGRLIGVSKIGAAGRESIIWRRVLLLPSVDGQALGAYVIQEAFYPAEEPVISA